MATKLSFLLTAALMTVSAVGCSEVAEPNPTTAKQEQAPPRTYKSRIIDCLEGVGFNTSAAGNATRIASPDGTAKANLHFFSSENKARAFYDQLLVPAELGSKAVVIFYAGWETDNTEERVIADCVKNP
jgi:hypothetical protein